MNRLQKSIHEAFTNSRAELDELGGNNKLSNKLYHAFDQTN